MAAMEPVMTRSRARRAAEEPESLRARVRTVEVVAAEGSAPTPLSYPAIRVLVYGVCWVLVGLLIVVPGLAADDAPAQVISDPHEVGARNAAGVAVSSPMVIRFMVISTDVLDQELMIVGNTPEGFTAFSVDGETVFEGTS